MTVAIIWQQTNYILNASHRLSTNNNDLETLCRRYLESSWRRLHYCLPPTCPDSKRPSEDVCAIQTSEKLISFDATALQSPAGNNNGRIDSSNRGGSRIFKKRGRTRLKVRSEHLYEKGEIAEIPYGRGPGLPHLKEPGSCEGCIMPYFESLWYKTWLKKYYSQYKFRGGVSLLRPRLDPPCTNRRNLACMISSINECPLLSCLYIHYSLLIQEYIGLMKIFNRYNAQPDF